MGDRLRVYTHANTAEEARALVDQGFTGIKMGGIPHCIRDITAIRKEVGDDIDIMVDLHGMP